MASKKKVNCKKPQKKEDKGAKESLEKSKEDKEAEESFEKLCSSMDTLGDTVSQYMQTSKIGIERYHDMEKEVLSMSDTDNKKAELLDTITEEKEIERKAAMQMQVKKMQVWDGKFQNTEGFDYGDQTPLKGNARKILEHQWSSGMDYQPFNPRFSNWLRVLFIGDYKAMMNIVENTRKEDIQKLIEKRESLMNIGAIFHVITGAKMLKGDSEENAELRKNFPNGDHMACFLKLLELGVNIHSKDVAGCTPLHHCVPRFVNEETMKMAKILLKNGANVNDQDRFGCTALREATIFGKLEVVEMLVKHGADPSIPDNDGKTCLTIHPFMYPKINAIFSKASHKFSKAQRKEAIEEAGGSLRKCSGCASMGEDNKRCTGCYLVWYCVRPCQLKHWKHHKEECKETQKQFVPVILQREKVMTTKNWKTGQVNVTHDTDVPSSSHFLVKIQIAEGMGHYVYNKDRSLVGKIPPHDSSYTQLQTGEDHQRKRTTWTQRLLLRHLE